MTMHARLYYYAYRLVLIALAWKVRPGFAVKDICNLNDASVFCNCEMVNDNQKVQCFVYGTVKPSSEVWNSFLKGENTVELILRSSVNSQLNFFPNDTLRKLPELALLTIHEGSLGVIATEAVSHLKKLENLNLERNEITALERHSIAYLPKLKKISLNENKITEIIADTFDGLDELDQLNLNTNEISRLDPCAFCNLRNLKELELWRNSIKDITRYTFRGLTRVTRLDLDHNLLSVLGDNVFEDLPSLTELSINNNLLQVVGPMAFNGLTKLTTLRMNYNKLSTLPDTVFHPTPNLISLRLERNLLESIQPPLVDGLAKALRDNFDFNFNGNPLKCSCDLYWIIEYSSKAKSLSFVRDLLQITCQTTDGQEQEVHMTDVRNCDEKFGVEESKAVVTTYVEVPTLPSKKRTAESPKTTTTHPTTTKTPKSTDRPTRPLHRKTNAPPTTQGSKSHSKGQETKVPHRQKNTGTPSPKQQKPSAPRGRPTHVVTRKHGNTATTTTKSTD